MHKRYRTLANCVSQAVFRFLGCRFTCDAHLNAAINILGAGLALREARAEREARDGVNSAIYSRAGP